MAPHPFELAKLSNEDLCFAFLCAMDPKELIVVEETFNHAIPEEINKVGLFCPAQWFLVPSLSSFKIHLYDGDETRLLQTLPQLLLPDLASEERMINRLFPSNLDVKSLEDEFVFPG